MSDLDTGNVSFNRVIIDNLSFFLDKKSVPNYLQSMTLKLFSNIGSSGSKYQMWQVVRFKYQ